MTLPGENGQNLVEWRFRKEQAQGKVNVFGRKLRVSQHQREVTATCPPCPRGQAWDTAPVHAQGNRPFLQELQPPIQLSDRIEEKPAI